MKDIKPIIAKNLAYFRKENGLTQAQLAQMLNYSDKAISRWELGDTLPDINVLCQICEFYGIDLNTLTSEEVEYTAGLKKDGPTKPVVYRVCIGLLTISVVWLVAVLVFVYSGMMGGSYEWIAFVAALPLSCLVIWLTGLKVRMNTVVKVVNNSIMVWTFLLFVYLWFLINGYNFWAFFLVGLPVQAMIILYIWVKKYR